MITFAIEPFDAIDGSTSKPSRVVGVDASGLRPEFIIMITDANGWTHLTRTDSVQRQGDAAEIPA